MRNKQEELDVVPDKPRVPFWLAAGNAVLLAYSGLDSVVEWVVKGILSNTVTKVLPGYGQDLIARAAALEVLRAVESRPRGTLDERVARLQVLRRDLADAVELVDELQVESVERKEELSRLRQALTDVKRDKESAEAALQLSEESLARAFHQAGRIHAWTGALKGFCVGVASSLVAAFLLRVLTKGH